MLEIKLSAFFISIVKLKHPPNTLLELHSNSSFHIFSFHFVYSFFYPSMKTKYSYKPANPATSVKAASRDTRISFKNTRETSRMLKDKKIDEAITYLQNVINHKTCVPMRRYATKCGRTRQAKEYGTQRGRWPQKSCEFLIYLLNNMKANAAHKNLDVSTLVITHVQVNKAPKIYGRLHRAHGRVNSYNSSPCHIEIVAEKEIVQMEDTDQRIEELN